MEDNKQRRQLQKGIEVRQHEFHRVAHILTHHAKKTHKRWIYFKIALITLGALGVSKGAFDRLLSADNIFNLIFFTLIGLMVAILTGLETAFKYESKNIELKILASDCHSSIRQIDTLWYQKVGDGNLESRILESKILLEVQDAKLAEIQARAARLGINLDYGIARDIDGQVYTA